MGVMDGIKVVEVAEHGFVPSAAAILADWGADVVKVERATGDPLRHIMGAGFVADTGDFNFLFEQFNRNKRGVSIDLRTDDGRAALDRLLEWADVFITNFLPSARTNLRIQPEDVWAVNPRLVYARGHGQGQRGPDADQGGFDAVSYWSRGGIGHMLTPPDGPFIMQRGAMGDAPSGAFLAGGVGTALFQRERTGKGVLVDVALLGSAVWTLAVDLVPTSVLEHDPDKFGATVLSSPLVGPYATADARWIVLNMLDPERHWAPACRALGIAHLIEHPDYATTALRAENRVALREIFVETIGKQTLADLKAALSAHDTIFSALASPTEVLVDPQVEANGYMPRHPEHERAASRPARCSSTWRRRSCAAAHQRWASTPTRCSASSASPRPRSPRSAIPGRSRKNFGARVNRAASPPVESLMGRDVGNDDDGFEEAFDALFSAARRIAVRLVGAGPEADDVAAEALARAYARWSKIRELDYRDAWVMRVTANVALDVLRRSRRPLPPPVADEADPADAPSPVSPSPRRCAASLAANATSWCCATSPISVKPTSPSRSVSPPAP